jgi:release factor glutamine methyltransferase
VTDAGDVEARSTGADPVTRDAQTVASTDGRSVRDLLLDVASRLGSATEARWMLEEAIGKRKGGIASARNGAMATPQMATPQDVSRLEEMVRRRLGGEPLQYVLGAWAFRTLELTVDPRVLIPRPETEVVVGHALDELALSAAESGDPTEILAADLGTGSGAIALSLAVEGPERIGGTPLRVWATDKDESSLELALHNSEDVSSSHPGMANVTFVRGSWFGALPRELEGQLSLAVANPPYISESEWDDLDPVVRDYEPRPAIVAGPLGTEAIDEILNAAPEWLRPNGTLVLEIAPHQAEDAVLRAIVSGFDAVVVRKDFADRSRALVARRGTHRPG